MLPMAMVGCGGEDSGTEDERGCSPASGVTSSGSTVAPEVLELFVDPVQGADSNAGTAKAPYRTLGKALLLAHAGQTIRLQGGTYSAQSGETWSVAVPEGVAIWAVTPGQAVLAGTSEATGLQFEGNSDVRSLTITGFGQALSADTGDHVWRDLVLKDNGTGVTLSGSARATGDGLDVESKAKGIVSAFSLRGSTSYTLENSTLHDLGDACGHGTIGTVGAAATFVGAGLDIHDADGSLDVSGAATATLVSSQLAFVGSNGCGIGEAIGLQDAAWLDLNDVSMSDLRGEAVLVDGVARALIVAGAIETGDSPAVVVRGGAVQMESTKVEASAAKSAAVLAMSGTTLSITGATFSGCKTCVVVGGGSVALRGSTFESAGTAIELVAGTLDLGNAEDPGGNVFTTVTNTSLVVGAEGPLEIPAGGNLWRSTQGATLGLYPAGWTLAGPAGCEDAPPRNFCLKHAVTVTF